MVQETLSKATQTYKHHYDKKARNTPMKVGDKVLIMLPTDSNMLLLSWKGSFGIVGVFNYCDFRILL